MHSLPTSEMVQLESYRATTERPAASAGSSLKEPPFLVASPLHTLLTEKGDPRVAAKALLRHVAPELVVVNVESQVPWRVQQDLLIKLGDGRKLVLSLDPTANVKLLRCERDCVLSEGVLLDWLKSMPLFDSHNNGDTSSDNRSTILEKHGQISSQQHGDSLVGGRRASNYLGDYASAVQMYSSRCFERRLPAFALLARPQGFDLASLSEALSREEDASIDWQLGQLLRRTASHVSPTGMFGYAVDILSPSSLLPKSSVEMREGMSSYGFPTWSQAFHVMLEEVLRDLEDFWV